MPIAKEFRHLYGPEWKKVRAEILDRAQHCCERCGVPNKAEVLRLPGGWWCLGGSLQNTDWTVPGDSLIVCEDDSPPSERGFLVQPLWTDLYEERFGIRLSEARWSTVVICVCHLNHTPGDNEPSNLAAWCQWCHLDHDKGKHKETRSIRKDRQRPLLTAAIDGTTTSNYFDQSHSISGALHEA